MTFSFWAVFVRIHLLGLISIQIVLCASVCTYVSGGRWDRRIILGCYHSNVLGGSALVQNKIDVN